MTAEALSPLATPSATAAVLAAHGLATKKSLGQNFLVNDGVLRRIVALAGLTGDERVLEVGPGIGTLTIALLKNSGRVVSVERDDDLPAVLAETCAPWADRFTLVHKDALDLTGDDLPFQPDRFVANLPYAVAATVVLDYFERFDFLQSATVMVQSEVADRMCARPGTKTYGAYTVKLGLYARPAGSFRVAPGNFFPPPHVSSTVLRLDRVVRDDLTPDEVRATAKMADAVFASRRKTAANSMKLYFGGDVLPTDTGASAPTIADLFAKADLDPRRRGETFDDGEFARLGREFLHLTQRGV